MSTAPAGWYKDPRDNGSPRYWTGEIWLAPGERPAVPVPAPQAGAFTPSAATAPSPGYGPTPVANHVDPAATAEPNAYLATFGDQGSSGEPDVQWDVVGEPRKPDAPATSPSARPDWTPATGQSSGPAAQPTYPAQPTFAAPTYGAQPTYQAQPNPQAPAYYGAPANYGATSPYGTTPPYQQASYSAPPAVGPYGYAHTPRRRVSPLWIIASVAAFLVTAVGVNWGLHTFLGPDKPAVAAVSATPSITPPPSAEHSTASQPPIGPGDTGELKSPSGAFTFLVDPSWVFDSASVESSVTAPGETPVGAWWTGDASVSPTALWVGISEYTLPASSIEQVHQDGVDAFVLDIDVVSRETGPFTENTGAGGIMTEVRVTGNGIAQRGEIYTYESNGHFLTLFVVGSDTDITRVNAEGIRFFVGPTRAS